MGSSIAFRLRTFFWLTKALVRRYHTFLIVGFTVGLILFISATVIYSFINSRIENTSVKRIGITGQYTPTDFPVSIQKLISYGLTDLTPSGEATAAAAASWDVLDDGKVYVFHLKPNLFWQDEKSFEAKDVNYNLKDAEVSSPNNLTIQIRLKEPFAPLPVLLSQPLFREGLTGLGQYKASSMELKENHLSSLTLAPVNQSSNLRPLQYKFYPTEDMAIMAYKLGEIDIIEGVHNLSPLINWPVKVAPKPMENWQVVLLYNIDDDFLSQKTARQALTYALPDFKQAEKATSPISYHSWAYNEDVKKYDPDTTLAHELLKQGTESSKSAVNKITLSTTPEYAGIAQKISKSWGDLNIQVKVNVVKDVPDSFQVFLTAQEIPVDPDQYSLWHSTQKKTNITHYKNPRIDKLLEDGRKLVDQDDRRQKYLDFQKYLVDDAPAAFLYYPTVYTISRH